MLTIFVNCLHEINIKLNNNSADFFIYYIMFDRQFVHKMGMNGYLFIITCNSNVLRSALPLQPSYFLSPFF